MPFDLKVTPAEYKAGLDRTIEKGWPLLNESGTFGSHRQARILLELPYLLQLLVGM